MSSPPICRKRFAPATSPINLKPSYIRFQAGRKLFSCLPAVL
jgi:hypothetical protein